MVTNVAGVQCQRQEQCGGCENLLASRRSVRRHCKHSEMGLATITTTPCDQYAKLPDDLAYWSVWCGNNTYWPASAAIGVSISMVSRPSIALMPVQALVRASWNKAAWSRSSVAQ